MVRRVVTATDPERSSIIASDAAAPVIEYQHVPGFTHSVVWTTPAPPDPTADGSAVPANYIPGPGSTIAMTMTFPPDSIYLDSGFDVAAAGAEMFQKTPGLAELFEVDAPGMHRTPTVDYVVVLDGKVVLELDNGVSTTLTAGDVVVQNATRHAWRVPFEQPATIFVVLMGQR